MKIRSLFADYQYGGGWRLKRWVRVTLLILAPILSVWSIGSGIYITAVNISRSACYKYADITERDAQFVKTGFFQWDCFVRVDGHWVLREQVRTISEGD